MGDDGSLIECCGDLDAGPYAICEVREKGLKVKGVRDLKFASRKEPRSSGHIKNIVIRRDLFKQPFLWNALELFRTTGWRRIKCKQ